MHSFIIRQLGKVAWLLIIILHIWAKSSNVLIVIISLLRRVAWCLIINQYIWDKSKGNLVTFKTSIYLSHKFQCSECEYPAMQKGHKFLHQRSLHKSQKFQCAWCHYKATQKGRLVTHLNLYGRTVLMSRVQISVQFQNCSFLAS